MWSKIPVFAIRSQSCLCKTALLLPLLICARIVCGLTRCLSAGVNWEGQTGVFVTPLAYVAPSPDSGPAAPVVAYHYLNAGKVLGGFHQFSISDSAFHHIEFGYTRDFIKAAVPMVLAICGVTVSTSFMESSTSSRKTSRAFAGCQRFPLGLSCAPRYTM